jgi:murein DD-endopeptidase MepM/ murein hydrolase activator NlpD
MYDFHYGVDGLYPHKDELAGHPWTSSSGRWAVPPGVPALAYADGIVKRSAWISTGDLVTLDHGGGLETLYIHLRDRRVRKGQKVREGQPLGTISFSPWCRDCPKAKPPPAKPPKVGLNHIHWEVHKNGKAVDPKPYWNAARLAPMPFELGPFLVKLTITGAIAYVAYRYLFR